MIYICMFFFFKQKTAYELRISDWSSDVCSSDLGAISSPMESSGGFEITANEEYPGPAQVEAGAAPSGVFTPSCSGSGKSPRVRMRYPLKSVIGMSPQRARSSAPRRRARSEEHTSELQSLMRISYAVFCLKKKKIDNIRPILTQHNNKISPLIVN